jgi:hypothetical protein
VRPSASLCLRFRSTSWHDHSADRERLSKLLTLMTVHVRTGADARVSAEPLRERIWLAGGAAAQVRPHDDRKGGYSLYS